MSTILETLDGALGPCAALLRHAHREPILDFHRAFDVPLTGRGRAEARALGAALARWGRIELWHSASPRCAETAAELAAGAREAGAGVRLHGALDGLLGPYLRDVRGALDRAQALRRGFVRAWFDGRIPPELVVSRDEAARGQLAVLRGLLAALGSRPGLALGVTHDWNLLALRESYLGLRHEEVGWVDFLDGLALAPQGEGLRLWWRERGALLPAGEGGPAPRAAAPGGSPPGRPRPG